jgi:hypothetical protein
MKPKRIKVGDKLILTIRPVTPNDEPKKFLEEISGLKYADNSKDTYAQTVGVVSSYMCSHEPSDVNAKKVFTAAKLIVGEYLAERTGGDFCKTHEGEFLIYVPCPEGHYIIDCSGISESIIDGSWTYSDSIIPVETLSDAPKADGRKKKAKTGEIPAHHETVKNQNIKKQLKTKNDVKIYN